MDKEYVKALARVRLERAEELLQEAKSLLAEDHYKSANNRAYYSIEKSVKALLALKETDASTHNGVLKQFNYLYIFNGDGTFTSDDYKMIAGAEQIRNASDYDDFYITNKEETRQQVSNAEMIYNKTSEFITSHI